MAGAAADPRSKFLETSARHYFLSAPVTSAYLMSQRVIEAAESNSPKHRGRLDTNCGACSAILVPGQTSRKEIMNKTGSKVRRSGKKNSNTENKFVRTTCLICHRFKDEPLCKPLGSGSNILQVTEPQGISHTAKSASTATRPTTSGASSSKQRAKARKQNGLQAMLDRSKISTSSPSGFGLDLMDLMKQD